MSGAWRGQTGTREAGTRQRASACVSSGSDVGEVSGAWCGNQGTKKAEAPRGAARPEGEEEESEDQNEQHPQHGASSHRPRRLR